MMCWEDPSHPYEPSKHMPRGCKREENTNGVLCLVCGEVPETIHNPVCHPDPACRIGSYCERCCPICRDSLGGTVVQ